MIKINACASGVGMYTLDPPWMDEMTYDEIAAICQEAHKFQRRVAAHVAGGQGITDAIAAGVDSLEHAHWLTDEQIEKMVEKGTFYVPTLIVNSRSVALGADQPAISATAWKWLIKADEAKWDSLARARAAGVKIATGSDAGFLVEHGESACEIEELVKGGGSPLKALTAATRTAAECLGMQQDIGTLEAGKLADFIVVDGEGDHVIHRRDWHTKVAESNRLYDGWTTRGQVYATIVSGKLVYCGGRFDGQRGDGKLLRPDRNALTTDLSVLADLPSTSR